MSYIPNFLTALESNLTEEELKDEFGSLKLSKSPGFGNIYVNITKNTCYEIITPLMNLFQQSIKFEVFPDEMKIAKFFPLCHSKDICTIQLWTNFCSTMFLYNP